MTKIDQIETEAREALYTPHFGFSQKHVVGAECDVIQCSMIGSMINRGMATGLCYKATWYINGKRTSRAKVADLLEKAA